MSNQGIIHKGTTLDLGQTYLQNMDHQKKHSKLQRKHSPKLELLSLLYQKHTAPLQSLFPMIRGITMKLYK